MSEEQQARGKIFNLAAAASEQAEFAKADKPPKQNQLIVGNPEWLELFVQQNSFLARIAAALERIAEQAKNLTPRREFPPLQAGQHLKSEDER